MAQTCALCGKKPTFGRIVSHAHNVSLRRFNPNLQTVRAVVDGAHQAHPRLHALHQVEQGREGRLMAHEALATDRAPQAIGPYSQAIRAGDLLFVSGQIPLDPATGTLVEGDIAVQTRRVLDNLAAILAAAGASFEHVVKTTVFLLDMNDFAAMNAVYATYVPTPPPARSTVQVSRLPRDVRVEIDVIARRLTHDRAARHSRSTRTGT